MSFPTIILSILALIAAAAMSGTGAGVPRPQPHQPGLQVPPLLTPHIGRVRRQGGQLALQVPQEEEGKYHRAKLQICWIGGF